jgi:hypothetical protein
VTGSTLPLATLFCECGCSMSWRGLTTSPNRYFSKDHARQAFHHAAGVLSFETDGAKGAADLAKRKVRELSGNGLSPRKIRNQLNAMGIETSHGRAFTTSDVLRLMRVGKNE